MDPSIVSNILVLRQQKRIAPAVGEVFSTVLQYPGKIHPGELVSTYFQYFDGALYVTAYIGDQPDDMPPDYNGTGTLNIYDAATGVVITDIGSVEYATGRVTINNLSVAGYMGNDTMLRISTNLQESSRDLIPQNKEILVLDDTQGDAATAAINGVSINVVSSNL
jgi:hypothetical protein